MVKLVCVGLGGHGYGMCRLAAESGDFKVVAGVDPSRTARRKFKDEIKAPVFSSPEEAFENIRADAALVEAPDSLHAPISLMALKKGMDVLCEKPMADNYSDALKMCRAADKHGRLLMVNQSLRWQGHFRAAREIVEKGKLGRILHVDFQLRVFYRHSKSGYRASLPHLILQDLGIHHFDILRFVSGCEFSGVYAKTWSDENSRAGKKPATSACAMLDTVCGAAVTYCATMRALRDKTDYSGDLSIRGEEGLLRVRDGNVVLYGAGGKAEHIPPGGNGQNALKTFASAVLTREPPGTSCRDNLLSLKTLFSAIKSADTGRRVQINTQ